MRHYWIILLNDGTYKELVGTEDYVKEWMSTHYPSKDTEKLFGMIKKKVLTNHQIYIIMNISSKGNEVDKNENFKTF